MIEVIELKFQTNDGIISYTDAENLDAYGHIYIPETFNYVKAVDFFKDCRAKILPGYVVYNEHSDIRATNNYDTAKDIVARSTSPDKCLLAREAIVYLKSEGAMLVEIHEDKFEVV